jgi:tetratricopeptide (TPR) repeat protein
MALSDTGQLDDAVNHLRRAIALAGDFTNARVALGVALQRQGKIGEAIAVLNEAVNRDPENSWAERNLGACLLKAGRAQEAEAHLRRATLLDPKDQQAMFGLAEALTALGRPEGADEAYRKVIEINEYSKIAELAQESRRKMAERTFKDRAGGTARPDAVMYCLGALEKFEKMSRSEVQRIASEIAMEGRSGLDTNDPAQKYELKSLAGKFSGLQLVCLMYVAFKSISPEMDIGFDLSKEYAAAQALHEKKTVH